MTQGVPKGYDPAWRAIQGPVRFDPPPAALPDAQRARLPSYALAPPPPPAEPAAPPRRTRRPRRAVVAGLSAGGLAALGLAGLVALRQPAPGPVTTLPAQFTVPLLVLRAAGPGQVVAVSVTAGQAVEPETPLLTFRPAGAAAEQTVRAGLHGVVRRLEARTGSLVQAADPLVQLADCSRAFLVVAEPAGLRAGQEVGIRLPGLPPFRGPVRRSAGPAEPEQALVVDAAGLAAVALSGCPAGGAAEILP